MDRFTPQTFDSYREGRSSFVLGRDDPDEALALELAEEREAAECRKAWREGRLAEAAHPEPDGLRDAGDENSEPECPAWIDTAIQTFGAPLSEFLAALRAHAVECACCGSDRLTVVRDRELVDPAAVCCERRVA